MMKFICFGSGSSGNCYYLLADGYGVLIDLGIGVRLFRKYFNEFGLSLAQIKAMLITHDHADHVKAAGMVSNEFNIPVYATSLVHQGMVRNFCMPKKVNKKNVRLLEKGGTLDVGPMHIVSFGVPHDSMDNVGYFVTCGERTFCLMTDVGHVTDEMAGYMERADYDATMLKNGPYPGHLKHRISNGNGHLCNDETARQLALHLKRDARHVWLCHLSAENNHPSLAYKTVEQKLVDAGFPLGTTLRLETLCRRSPSPLYELE